MLVPGLVPALSASPALAAGTISMVLIDPLTGGSSADSGYNILGETVQVTVSGISPATVTAWSLIPIVGTLATWVGADPNTLSPIPNTVNVTNGWGETSIMATLSDNTTLSIDKKWGQINETAITPPQSIPVTWNESAKTWTANATITDVVLGTYHFKDGPDFEHIAQGAILNWYLVDGHVTVPLTPGEIGFPPGYDPKAAISALLRAHLTTFTTGGTYKQTVTAANGQSSVTINTSGEEAVQVVVVPQYPISAQIPVTPEVTSVNFWTQEMEKVPQVRWAGEKIVLEKNWGTGLSGHLVRYSLENQSPGALEGIGVPPSGIGLNLTNTNDTVWTRVDSRGLSSVILVSEDPGEVDVDAALYGPDTEGPNQQSVIENQHGFVVFFMKLEDLKLGNVPGKRTGHDSGLWEPPNPWNPASDTENRTLNVSQDDLIRARVRGWFLNANPTTRPVRPVDITGDGVPDILLPAGRWVLPDDWPLLAGGSAMWKETRLHWDVMDNPSDGVISALNAQLGPYNSVNGLTNYTPAPPGLGATGPFSPGIEQMTPTGWNVGATSPDAARQMKTVVPNGLLEWWDTPMPPAKLIIEIMSGNGYFKTALKTAIYYLTAPGGVVYTNPFYQEMIPAHEAIPAFINNGGYDWSSFGNPLPNYGPYVFWTVINQNNYLAVPTSNPATRPTKVEVYSDNHGEGMVWLNGNWNLNLNPWNINGAADVPLGTVVGTTRVQGFADYPYLRKHPPVISNNLTKTWTWGGQVIGTDRELGTGSRMVLTTGNYTVTGGTGDNQVGTSDKKMVWVWVTDRDGKRDGVLGATVHWLLSPSSGGAAQISPYTVTVPPGVSPFNTTTQGIGLQDGFLTGTSGILDPVFTNRLAGYSKLIIPTGTLPALFAKFWPGLNVNNYVVAAIEVQSTNLLAPDVNVVVDITSTDYGILPGAPGKVSYHTDLDFSLSDPMDDAILPGDANLDGAVNMGDVVAVERMILGLQSGNTNASYLSPSGSVDMGCVVRIERILLGLPTN